jgi:hypothetical protein
VEVLVVEVLAEDLVVDLVEVLVVADSVVVEPEEAGSISFLN